MKHPYPLVECTKTGTVKPGYAVCVHLASGETQDVGEVESPNPHKLGLMLCAVCAAAGDGSLLACCADCTEELILNSSSAIGRA